MERRHGERMQGILGNWYYWDEHLGAGGDWVLDPNQTPDAAYTNTTNAVTITGLPQGTTLGGPQGQMVVGTTMTGTSGLTYEWNGATWVVQRERQGGEDVATAAEALRTDSPAFRWPGYPSTQDARVRVTELRDVMLGIEGWTEVNVPRLERYERDADTGPVLEKVFVGRIGGGPETRVRIRVNPRTLVYYTGLSEAETVHFYMVATTLSGPGHPHAAGSVCYRTGVRGRTYIEMPPTFMARALAANVEAFWTNMNVHSILNHQYGICHGCQQMLHVASGRTCRTCNGQYHRGCECHCTQAARALALPEGVERWRIGAQRMNFPTTTAEYRQAILHGCGVTGSWAALVLNRRFAAVHAYDPDRLSLARRQGVEYTNHSGAWVGGILTQEQIREQPGKVHAIERIRQIQHANTAIRVAEERTFATYDRPSSYYSQGEAHATPEGLNVICVDSAAARKKIVVRNPEMGPNVLDVRATPESVVFWSLPKARLRLSGTGTHHAAPHEFRGRVCLQCNQEIGRRVCDVWTIARYPVALHSGCVAAYQEANAESPWMAWWDSLDRYEEEERERCADHHDAVAMGAGVTTAYFLTWWLDNRTPFGVWSIPTDPMSRVEVPNAAQA